MLKQKRKDTLHGARDEQELKQQLAAIERAALGAVQSDRLTNPALTVKYLSDDQFHFIFIFH
jgi:hypothetical protein